MKGLFVFLAAFAACNISFAAELFGTVDAISGSASVIDPSGTSIAVSKGQKIYEGQTVKTDGSGEVHIITEDGGIIALRPDTEFRVDQYKAQGGSDDKIFMSLLKGALRSVTGWIAKTNHSAYLVATATATVGVRGTDHEITVIDRPGADAPGTYDTVNEGATVLKTEHGSADAAPGQFAFAPKDKGASPVILQKAPNYVAARSPLKIEGRIQSLKESLRGRLETMRHDRIEQAKSEHQERHEHARERRAHEHKL